MDLKILSRTIVSPDGCWLWQGAVNSGGHGVIKKNKKNHYVHRAILFGDEYSNSSLQANHKCRNKTCVNPEHLYRGTSSDNMRDCVERDNTHEKASRTHCREGHEYSPDNTYLTKLGHRVCISCRRNKYKKGDLSNIGSFNRNKKICANGHLYTKENTRIKKSSSGKTCRVCKTCARSESLRRYHAKKS